MSAERYEGAVGLERLKAHMCVAFVERKSGGSAGWPQEYFLGWLHGLAIADGIAAEIAVAAHQFVQERGYEQAWSKPSPDALRAIAVQDIDAAVQRLASIRRKVDGGSGHVTATDLQQAEGEFLRAQSFLGTLPGTLAAPTAP